MDAKTIIIENRVEGYVKDIFVLENEDDSKHSRLPFFADGYIGIMFYQGKNGVFLHPQHKNLADLILYGQTVTPIELEIKGKYKLIVFQLYPEAAKLVFDINPKEITDDCYDLKLLPGKAVTQTLTALYATPDTTKQVACIAKFISGMAQLAVHTGEPAIQLAINMVLENNGKITVKELTEKLFVTERTLQRQFAEYVGVSPKQFATIIQFRNSFNQVAEETFSKFTEVVYENGYNDQSHFIRNFKKFTDKKPSQFKAG